MSDRSLERQNARMQPPFKDEIVDPQKDTPNLRTGRFLWMDDIARKRYLTDLAQRIEQGYFYRDTIVTKIVDDIAPVINECLEDELNFRY